MFVIKMKKKCSYFN